MFKGRDKLTKLIDSHLAAGRTPAAVSSAALAVFRFYTGDVSYDTIFKTMMQLGDTLVSVRDLAWAMAGNRAHLKAGGVVRPFAWYGGETSVMVQVLGVRRVGFRDRKVVQVRTRILAGPGCPTVHDLRWSESAIRYYGCHPKVFGLDPTTREGYRRPEHLVGCRVFVTLVPQPDGKWKAKEYRGTAGTVKHNRKVAKLRVRQFSVCPRNYTHACHDCPHGFTECPAAVRPYPLVVVACPKCNADAPADRLWSEKVCFRCSCDSGRR